MGCPLDQLITGEICHASVRAGPFLSRAHGRVVLE